MTRQTLATIITSAAIWFSGSAPTLACPTTAVPACGPGSAPMLHIADQAGLEERGASFADYRRREMTGGPRQRDAVARALVSELEFLLQDEPFVDGSMEDALEFVGAGANGSLSGSPVVTVGDSTQNSDGLSAEQQAAAGATPDDDAALTSRVYPVGDLVMPILSDEPLPRTHGNRSGGAIR